MPSGAAIMLLQELHTESREEAYLRGQQNWDECISRLLKLLLALKPGIDEGHMHRTGRLAALPQGSACQSKKSRGGTETVCGHIWQVQTQTYPAGSYL